MSPMDPLSNTVKRNLDMQFEVDDVEHIWQYALQEMDKEEEQVQRKHPIIDELLEIENSLSIRKIYGKMADQQQDPKYPKY